MEGEGLEVREWKGREERRNKGREIERGVLSVLDSKSFRGP